MPSTAILWLRRDLRLDDNPALQAALVDCARLVPVYVYDPDSEAPWAPGAASRWWLHGSLSSLDQALQAFGSRLLIARGDSLAELRRIVAATGATRIHWNRLYDPTSRERDGRIKQALRADGLRVDSHNASLLFEPWEIATGTGEPYRVFTAFWRRCAARLSDVRPLPAPAVLPPPPESLDSLPLERLGLLPTIPWDAGLRETWTPGETAALEHARTFLRDRVRGYATVRDLPAQAGTSELSPHLHFGEIGPRRMIAMVKEQWDDPTADPVESFVREIGWREFAHHLIYHYPHTTDEPLDRRFAALPWREDDAERMLRAWQRGETGIPLVDAGMRQLWHTGWMHNRVRMVVASFLTKNLRLPWQAGARWFWDTLVDADLAANSLGWQWSAGCGADAAPYFRIFNPVLQGERFDKAGTYVRRWCPELARLPDKYIHQPWTAPAALLGHAGIRIGRDYPAPIVDLKASREAALAAYEVVKTAARAD
ncbi:cryptochrome/photolyase family protein [Thiocapsa rosea]|uniref:Deoxyribodipyrimidine photo-lyase n=1 Tax=Thiocapsa rosea TaxID=69360 RepID=A0A495V9W2_9GAMM|nr:deoxyribodipyrimidine photo-lyase [Thiocapsa rosea]RKT46084.1 deoxyribodipyrimidine photo-lyase [Thiocapsa rosea]